MHQPARLPENFDQNSREHPCSGIWFQNTLPHPPPPKIKIVRGVQVQPYPEHPPNEKLLTFFPEFKSQLTLQKWKTLTFFAEFKSELTQKTPPWKWKTLTLFAEFKSELTQNTPSPKMNKECFSALCRTSVTFGFCCVWSGWMLIGWTAVCVWKPCILSASIACGICCV